jgi:hypothetical protein
LQYPGQYRFGYCSITPRILFLLFKCCVWRCLWYAGFIFSDPLSKFYSVKFRPLFSRSGQTSDSFIWGLYAAEHGMVLIWKYCIEGSMFKAVHMHTIVWDGSKLYCLLGSKIQFHYCPSWTCSIKPSLQYWYRL